jgi:hypothetical protein
MCEWIHHLPCGQVLMRGIKRETWLTETSSGRASRLHEPARRPAEPLSVETTTALQGTCSLHNAFPKDYASWSLLGKPEFRIILSKVYRNIVDIIASGAAHNAKC